MKNIFNILIFSTIINITQAQGNIEILKQIVQSADLFQDFPIIKFIDTNKNLNDELAWRGKAAALEKLGKRDEAFKALIKSMKSAGIKLRKLGIR